MTLGALASTVRPLNLLLVWGATETGFRLAGGSGPIPAAIVPALLAAFGYARNDAVDVAADTINRPSRPIPSGRASRRSVLRLSWIFLALSAAFTMIFARGPVHLLLMSLFALALYLYSPWLKGGGPLGPATVALLAGLSVIWGGAMGPDPERSLAAGAVACLVTLARECAKDLEDEHGDRLGGKRTWPLRAGAGAPRLALRLAALAALLSIPIPWLNGDAGTIYLALSAGISAPILGFSAARPPRDAREARRISRLLKLALVAGIVGLWLGA